MRSLLGFWMGGLSAPRNINAGYRSLTAYWMGGICAPVSHRAGYKSLFGFWTGGICSDGINPKPNNDNGWLGGGADLHWEKKYREQIKRLDEINAQIRRKDYTDLVDTLVEIRKETKLPEINLDPEIEEIDLFLIRREINLIKEYLFAEYRLRLKRERDDELALILLLN